MSIREFGPDRRDEWDGLLDRSPEATPFHRYAFLEVLAEYTDAEVHPLVGYGDDGPIGLFPVFIIRKGPITTAFSPPPGMKIHYMGPVTVGTDALDRAGAEQRNRRFVRSALDRIADRFSPRYIYLYTATRYTDTRPFTWDGFDETPNFTYVVPLEDGADSVFDQFSRDARKNVREVRDADCEIVEADVDAATEIIRMVADRHEEQDEWFPLTPSFIEDLADALSADVFRPYACLMDDEVVGGTIALELGDTAYAWQGGAKPRIDLDVNDAVHWEIMQDATDRGVTRYDLVGANSPRLSRYKSKFAPSLESYVGLEKGGPAMSAAARAYKLLR